MLSTVASGQRRAGGLDRRHAGELLVPVEREAGGLEHPHRLGGDLGPDAVAGNQRRRRRSLARSGKHRGQRGSRARRRAWRRWPTGSAAPEDADRSARRPPPATARPGPGRRARGRSRARRAPRRCGRPTIAMRFRSEARSGSGTSLSFGERSTAWPIWSGSSTSPAARRASFRSSGGSTHFTSGARSVSAPPMSESAQVSVARWSRYGAKSVSDSKAGSMATSVIGMTATSGRRATGSARARRGTC